MLPDKSSSKGVLKARLPLCAGARDYCRASQPRGKNRDRTVPCDRDILIEMVRVKLESNPERRTVRVVEVVEASEPRDML